MTSIIEHVRAVAKDDVRLFLAPFVALFKVVQRELQRPPVR